MKKYRRITALICAVLAVFSLCACGMQGPIDDYIEGESAGRDLGQTSAADSVFTVNCSKGFSFNPLIATNTNNQLVCDLVYENIVELDNNYNVVANIATSWESKDGQYWTFHVDTDRYFHDGSKMTATDVAYSVQCARNSDRFKGRLYYVYGCSAVDDNTFVVTLGKKNMQFPMLLAIPVIKYGTYTDEFPQGTGPYTYANDHNSLIAFNKYPNYKNLPVDTVYLSDYDGGLDTIDAFEDSLIDVVMNDPTAPTNLGYGSANEIRGFNTTNMHYIAFNAYSTIFSYESVRAALNYAFDRDALLTQLNGFVSPTAIPVNPSYKYYNEDLNKQYSYDLSVCRSIFNNLGFEDMDQDGYVEMKMGEDNYMEVNMRFLVCSDSSCKVNVARKFAQDMDSMGVQVTLIEYSWKDYVTAVNAGNYDMCYYETRINPDFDLSRVIGTGGAVNCGQWSSEAVDNAISDYLAADDEHRAQACSDMCSTICGGGHLITLCFEKHQMITHRGAITGIKVCENNPLRNFANWTVSFANVEEKTDDTNEKGQRT